MSRHVHIPIQTAFATRTRFASLYHVPYARFKTYGIRHHPISLRTSCAVNRHPERDNSCRETRAGSTQDASLHLGRARLQVDSAEEQREGIYGVSVGSNNIGAYLEDHTLRTESVPGYFRRTFFSTQSCLQGNIACRPGLRRGTFC